MKRTWKAVVVVAVLALLGVSLWWTTAQNTPAAPIADAPSDDVASPAVSHVEPIVPGAPLRAANASWKLRYAFELNAGDAVGIVSVEVGGTLELASLRPVDSTTAGAEAVLDDPSDAAAGWLPVRLRDAQLKVSKPARKMLGFVGDTRDLQRPFSVRLEADGRVGEVRFADGLSTATRAILAAVAHGAQFVRPKDPSRSAWKADEVDVNGTYHAAYKREGSSAVVKHWQSPALRFGERAETKVRFALDGNAIARVEFDQRGKASLGSIHPKDFAPFSLHIELTRAGPAAGNWAGAVRPAKLIPFTAATAVMKTHERPRKTRDFALVLADVKARAERLDTGGRVNLRNELTRAIVRDSATVAKIESLLRTRELKGRAETVVMASLVGARTPAAQRSVATMVSDLKVTEMMRVRLLQAASFMSRPNASFVAALERLSQSKEDPRYAAAAATTLGATLMFYGEEHPTEAKAAIRRLTKRARAKVTPTRADKPNRTPMAIRLAWLAGLGNLGDPAALPSIIAALEDSNELVRGGAALALRFQSPAACLPAMTKMMAEDRSIHVRENLVDAARHMGPAVMRPMVERTLYLDESEYVRLAAAYTIAMWATTAPGLRKVLVEAVKRETKPRVIEALKNFIEPGRLPGKPVVSKVKMGGPGH